MPLPWLTSAPWPKRPAAQPHKSRFVFLPTENWQYPPSTAKKTVSTEKFCFWIRIDFEDDAKRFAPGVEKRLSVDKALDGVDFVEYGLERDRQPPFLV